MAPTQMQLFADPPARRPSVRPAEIGDDICELARRLPASVYLGTSSWSFPGWAGLVYGKRYPPARLAAEGLQAYARHPLLRAVSIDRSYYAPVEAARLREYHDAVPDEFRFLVKAHDACTLARFPRHARYGEKADQRNLLYLNPAYATDVVVGPVLEGLGKKAALLLFQFAPQAALSPAVEFAARLEAFLEALPRGLRYGIELRNRELLGEAYRAVLRTTGAVHCLNVHPSMPELRSQLDRLAAGAEASAAPAEPLFVRWMLGAGLSYESAVETYAPFDRLAREDPPARRSIAELCVDAVASGAPAFVLINNKAEGCAPRSVVELARTVVAGVATSPGDAG